MSDKEQLKKQIRDAFAHVEYPGDWCLRGSNEGDEPFLVEQEFKGKSDWTTLDTQFLDQAPGGFSSALSFFSDEAFHFYIPAYMIADVDGLLEQADPVFHLTHGLWGCARNDRINPRRYGGRTWWDEVVHKFSMFNQTEASAIVAYLKYKRESEENERAEIDEALRNYWNSRIV